LVVAVHGNNKKKEQKERKREAKRMKRKIEVNIWLHEYRNIVTIFNKGCPLEKNYVTVDEN